ncbi:MAG: DUF2934 domain-containing protein [Bryobacterales bacterium]|nr:DUF2934 domain-containing protein [Bryobacterales bacterium]
MAKKRIPHSTEATIKVPSPEALADRAAPAKEKKSHSTRTRKMKPAAVAVTPAAANAGTLSKAVARETCAYPHDEIARLAYSFWEQRGGQDGNAVEDWLRAERHLLNGAAL